MLHEQNRWRKLFLSGLVVILASIPVLAGCGGDGSSISTTPMSNNTTSNTTSSNGDVMETADFRVSELEIAASLEAGTLRVQVPVTSKIMGPLALEGRVTLEGFDGRSYGEGEGNVNLAGESSGVFEAQVPVGGAALGVGESMGFVLRYQIESAPTPEATAHGTRSLYHTLKHEQIYLLSSDTYFAGSKAVVRIIAQDVEQRTLLVNRPVVITLTPEEGVPVRLEGETDDAGTFQTDVEVPEDAQGSWTLKAEVESSSGTAEMESTVQIRRESRVLLVTDKPFYQPGQTIFIRSLAMRRPALVPEAGQEVTIEVQDPKGNKVFREVGQTDAFGVASAKFKLARELNMGTYRILATVGDTTSERAVTVERYALPKFRTELSTDQGFYQPGDMVHGTLRAGYFFGKPVSGGAVVIQAYKFDLEFELFADLTGTLDAQGAWDFDLQLPSFFVGQPLEQGNAFVRLDISVTDGAGHTQTMTRNLAVSQDPLLMQAIPAADPVPGAPLDLFVLLSEPTGAPQMAAGTLSYGGETLGFETNAQGIARMTLEEVTQIPLMVQVSSGEQTKTFSMGTAARLDHALSIRADQALYRAGDTVTLQARATPGIDRVFLDVLKDNQIVISTMETVAGGEATIALDLSEDLVGNLQFEGYAIAPDGNIIRSHALVFVEAANDLQVTLTPEEESYKPGEMATVDIEVTDADGDGVVSSVGLMVVDEAVFALQDFRPGMEKIYFQLEQEILVPRYEIHGHSAETVLRDDPDVDEEARDDAASVVFAASAGMPSHGVFVDTWAEAQSRSETIAAQVQQADMQAIRDAVEADLADAVSQDVQNIEVMVGEWITMKEGAYLDPWGRAYTMQADRWTLMVRGSGPDEVAGSADDFAGTLDLSFLYPWQSNGTVDNGGTSNGTTATSNGTTGDGGGDEPRVRSYFPETLFVDPGVITDAQGKATVEIALADSITTWRMTGIASSQDGGLGSVLSGIRVFQEFFVDINFPATLTQADEVTVPVALYNYLETSQTVTLRVDETEDDWYVLLDGGEREVTLEPGEVRGESFRVKVTRPGWHDFQVTAIGAVLSDAVRRRVLVVPDGQEQFLNISDRLEGNASHTLTFPAEAIDGAYGLQAKIYSGFMSQAVEGLERMLQVPSGCFEQTSSTTYPNVLVLNYLRETEQSNPEVELQALEYINLGYQRLLSFEVPGGGFEWFGQDPAHRILTAYGLLEFSDMSKVTYVDPEVIARTQAWLVSKQEADGSWRAAPEGIHEGATNSFTDSDLRATAYIVYALLESGYEGSAVNGALNYMRQNLTGVDDAYSLALVANAFLVNDPGDATARTLAEQVDGLKECDEEAGTCWWSSDSTSFTYGTGSSMDIETTAYALQALQRAGGYNDTLERGTTWLIGNKDQFGTWSNTQGTILTLRFLLSTLGSGPQEADATVSVYHDDVLVRTMAITTEDSDVLRLVDLIDRAHAGSNDVRVEFEGTGQFMYQITGRYYVPWTETPIPSGPLAIDVTYDKTTLESDAFATATVTVGNTTAERLDMILVDLGVPPGFDVVLDDFQPYIEEGPISRVDTTGRQILVYLYGIDGMEEVTFSYRIQAGEPLRAQSPPSQAYLYYESDQRAESAPEMFEVTD